MTERENQRIIDALEGGTFTATEIAKLIGSTPRVVATVCHLLENAGRISRVGTMRVGKGARAPLWSLPGQEDISRASAPKRQEPPRVIDWPDTLTGIMFGDPAPGRSALDARRAQA